jgi:hypothetical protein
MSVGIPAAKRSTNPDAFTIAAERDRADVSRRRPSSTHRTRQYPPTPTGSHADTPHPNTNTSRPRPRGGSASEMTVTFAMRIG